MLYYHPLKKIKLDTAKHGSLDDKDLIKQGFEPFTTTYEKKGDYYVRRMRTPSGHEEAIQMPKGWLPPGVAPDVRNLLGEKTNNIVNSTADIKKQEKMGQKSLQNVMADLDNLGEDDTLTDMGLNYDNPEIIKAKDYLEKQKQNVERLINAEKILNTDDLKEIEEAGKAAGLEFDPLIQKAIEAKKAGLPKAVIAAGERGGFMNTQFAGIAALQPIQGGDFLGIGGELERVKSAYDSVILNLKSQKEAAILAAKRAAKQAILTGKKEDTDRAMQLYDMARQSYQDAIQAVNDKVNLIQKLMDIKHAQAKMEQEKIEWGIANQNAEIELENAKHLTEKLQRDFENELSLKGYKKIVNPDQLQGLTEQDIVRIQNPVTGGEDIWLKPADQKDDYQIIKSWIEKYPDAGIELNDDLMTARNKLVNNSKIFRKKMRIGGSGSSAGGEIKFTDQEKKILKAYQMDNADPDIQNEFLRKLTSREREQFAADWKQTMEEMQMSIDPDVYFQAWYEAKLEEESQQEAQKSSSREEKNKYSQMSLGELKEEAQKYVDEDGNVDVEKMPRALYDELVRTKIIIPNE